ncbi:hypothetical protein SAMN03159341_108164 [Paenibacillus sp. 1_12]|uniref:hypothetical protein n=1 Tax=Paenibacillus sp. 1_12 TaxID=1566278 RepID=UPI0008F43B9D|nr:hypothetical protein [Paenibacillus sp. 1_12]SFL67354.1 hypothetical protein SAMN03159341_108164 [Paenibacillus sp. 1_12]
MELINHINYTDQNDNIYCCLRNRVVKLNQAQQEQFCKSCKMFAGTADGRGVECAWEDVRNVSNPHIVIDPAREFISNQRRVVFQENWSQRTSYCV